MPIQADRIAADIRAIAACTHTPGNGATRPTFSPEWAKARDYVISQARKIGCEVRIDAAGNVFMKPASLSLKPARLRAEDAGAAPVKTWLCGSHIDTVPHGGDYDGVAGIVVALELLRSAFEEQIDLPLELVIFAEEEGPTFGLGMLGSRAIVGELAAEQLGQLKNKEGQTYLEAGAPYGVKPDELAASRLRPEAHHGLIELHIEQGPGMWRRDQKLAVVTAIAGRQQYLVTLTGEANHAGATSMNDRKDALVAAAQITHGLEALVKKISPSAVATVGRMNISPNAINVIPDRVEFTIDFRAPTDDQLRAGDEAIADLVRETCMERLMPVTLRRTEAIPARPMNPKLVIALDKDLPVVVSGALHDSAVIAPHLPTVMLFVPSKDGISHNPAEFSRVEDIAEGARVIERLVRRPAIDLVNAMDGNEFLRLAGRFYEHSPWVAERVFEQRPFQSVDDLANQMSRVVRNAPAELQLELIRAHPDLVGRLAKENKLTSESTAEQRAAGLTTLSPTEVEQFEEFNASYHRKFGFPFVICARQNKKDAILAAFPVRLNNSVEKELVTALAEIDKIALLRMRDAMWE
jgi:allantoate deiminase